MSEYSTVKCRKCTLNISQHYSHKCIFYWTYYLENLRRNCIKWSGCNQKCVHTRAFPFASCSFSICVRVKSFCVHQWVNVFHSVSSVLRLVLVRVFRFVQITVYYLSFSFVRDFVNMQESTLWLVMFIYPYFVECAPIHFGGAIVQEKESESERKKTAPTTTFP